MDDRSPVWSFGESQLLHDPTDALDAKWWFGESIIFDEYVESEPPVGNIPLGNPFSRPFRQTFGRGGF
jgi:hypothetical protein